MTKYNETGHGFWLFPPEQWKDITKAYRENIKALRGVHRQAAGIGMPHLRRGHQGEKRNRFWSSSF
jgi:hypothetical protein